MIDHAFKRSKTSGNISADTNSVADRSRNPITTTTWTTAATTTETTAIITTTITTTTTATATTGVGHLYRQLSRRKKKKKNSDTAISSSSLQPCPPPQPQPQLQPSINLCIQPALIADVIDAPAWLVTDQFVSEHVVHEYVSVVPEPDHVDPMPVMPDRSPPSPSPPAVRALSDFSTSATTVESPSVATASLCAHEPGHSIFSVQQLVDNLIGPYYVNYRETRAVLVRQAKQLFINVYQSDIVNFHECFCIPANEILKKISEMCRRNECCDACAGWPLSHGRCGVLTHLVAPDFSSPGGVPSSDAYLLLDVASAGLTLNWVGAGARFRSRLSTDTVVMLADDLQQLCTTLKHLVAVVDRSVQRVPLDRIKYPCYGCKDRMCVQSTSCQQQPSSNNGDSTVTVTAASAVQLQRQQYENVVGDEHAYDDMDNSIPHIDSDPEDVAQDSRHQKVDNNVADRTIMIHTQKQRQSIRVPKSICDLSEDVLMSGLQFPGAVDRQGNALILWVEAQSGTHSDKLSDVNAAELILYYASLRNRNERNLSLTILVHENSCASIEFVDCVLVLLKHQVSVDKVIFCTKRHAEGNRLKHSQIRCYAINSYSGLLEFFEDSQIPLACGGPYSHSQLEWIDFYKESERLTCLCQTAGNRLVTAVTDIGNAPQERNAISKFLDDSDIKNLLQDARQSMEMLEQHARWLNEDRFVMSSFEDVKKFHGEVEGAAVRLEELLLQKKKKIMQAARVHALESETHEVLSWLTNKGEHALVQHADLANSLPAIRQQEQDFEKFYFVSMQNLDRAGDLLEEAGQCSNGTSLKDLAKSLKQHLRGFSDRLEETRERLEDTSRCFYLLDKAYDWALECMKYISVKHDSCNVKELRRYLMAHPSPTAQHFSEMMMLANKLNNEKLMKQCKVAMVRCEETNDQLKHLLGPDTFPTSTPLPSRRTSAPEHNITNGNTTMDNHHCGWVGAMEDNCYCETDRLALSHIPSANWTYNDEEDEEKLSCSHTTEGSDENKSNEESDDTNSPDSGFNKNQSLPPLSVNSHLHHMSNLQLNMDCGTQTLKLQKTVKLIMREMIQTERDYVKSLEYVIENYVPMLLKEEIPQVLRGQRNVIFGNIEKIYEFHSQHFLKELERHENCPLQVGESFLKHEKKFYLYALYNKNKPNSDSLMSEYGSVFFKTKQMELRDRMDLASYLLKPVQRMGKYALLLQQLMKMAKGDTEHLRMAESMVRFQLRHGNDLLAMDSLRECDVNLKEQGRLLRQNEFLVWQGKGKKCLRQVFLFEELILFSKARRFPDRTNLDLYVYKNSIKTSDIGFTAKVGDSNTKFEIWFRKRKPGDTYTLVSMSEDIKQAWTDELSNLLWKQALRNREIRLAEMSSMGIGNKPCLDIRPSADQINDRSITFAQLSKTAPRFRNSIVALPSDLDSIAKRPHSIISVSSSSAGSNSSSSGSSSGASCRSSEGARQTSQCSSQSTESGIVADWYSRNSHSGSVASDTLSPPPPSTTTASTKQAKATKATSDAPPSTRLSVKL
ncbi:rho guanine nucleotide exchange factor 40-like isoform X2 [Sipha flava]|uniref:Rho guanine nucleotide exchange factor 40-like isoform X2 n=1 Tax=Sipha flava TaxID=143950 RepID=A0A8B8FHH3_9HEMI|nr:rho guanine nucleotide exchange factor 40-like isoform X2 [Sipha flava]